MRKINIKSILKIIGILLIFTSTTLVILKALELSNYGVNILPELIAPTKLSNDGNEALDRLKLKYRTEHDSCIVNKNCKDNREIQDSRINLVTSQYLESRIKAEDINNIIENIVFLSDEASYRGYYLHHYNTILESYRALRSGDMLRGMTSQYGLISTLPLYLMEGMPFYYYPLLSLIILSVIILSTLRFIKDGDKLLIIGMLFLLVSLTINVPGVRVSPGFSIYRFLPLLFILLLLNNQNNEIKLSKMIVILVLMLVNSIQFNILVIVFYFIILQFNKTYKNLFPIWNQLLNVMITVVGVQLVAYYYSNSEFKFPLFGSVGQSKLDLMYCAIFIGFPILIISTSSIKKAQINFNSYIGYGLLSSYVISFYGSPQHFSNFILIALPFIYIIIISLDYSIWIKFLACIFFYIVAFNYNYLILPNIYNNVNLSSNYFKYNNIGSQLKFGMSNDIEKLNTDFNEILKKNNIDKFFLLSKDKIYFELYENKNIRPFNFDIFVNINSVNKKKITNAMKKNGIEYLIIDSKEQINLTVDYLKSPANSLANVPERQSYIDLEERLALIGKDFNDYLLKCEKRYCIYKIQLYK